MYRLLNGFLHILLILVLISIVLATMASVAWMIGNTTWLNLVWIVPLFIGGCWIMGDDFE